MPKLEYFLISESVSVDRETNRISVFNVIEDFHLTGIHLATQQPGIESAELPPNSAEGKSRLQGIISGFVAVACFNREEGDEGRKFLGNLTLRSNDTVCFSQDMPFQLENLRNRVIMRFVGLPEISAGVLRFVFNVDGKEAASHTVNVF